MSEGNFVLNERPLHCLVLVLLHLKRTIQIDSALKPQEMNFNSFLNFLRSRGF